MDDEEENTEKEFFETFCTNIKNKNITCIAHFIACFVLNLSADNLHYIASSHSLMV